MAKSTASADPHLSIDELGERFRARAMSALLETDRDLPIDRRRFTLDELVAMFAASAKNGRCPTREILSGFPHLHTTGWAERMMQVQQGLAKRSTEAQEALHSLSHIESFLHPLMIADKLAGQIPGHNATDADVLRSFFPALRQVASIIGKTRRGSTISAWHKPAEIVALHAIVAWQLAGRKVIGIEHISPLTTFVQAWLARGCNLNLTTYAIAAVFAEGPVHRWAKSPTRSGNRK